MTPPEPGSAADETGTAAHVFVDDGRALDDELRIDGADGHHLQRARRLGPGEEVTAADGDGRWRRYRIEHADRGALDLAATGLVRVEPRSAYEIVAAPALVSRNRFDGVVAQLIELGVDAIVPLVAERCVARWDRPDPGAVTERLRAVAREASMQCRRSRVPHVEPPSTPSQIAALGAQIVVATRDAPSTRDVALARANVIVSGPEGGLSSRDLTELGAHICLRLGRYVLRAETAAVAAAALFTERREHCEG